MVADRKLVAGIVEFRLPEFSGPVKGIDEGEGAERFNSHGASY